MTRGFLGQVQKLGEGEDAGPQLARAGIPKAGEEPGFFAVLNAPSIEEAKAMVEAGVERLQVFDLEVVPVNQFPHFG